MFRHKLDVFVNGPYAGSDEKVAMSFLVKGETMDGIFNEPPEEELLFTSVALMPLEDLAHVAVALHLGKLSNSTQVFFDGVELDSEVVARLTESTFTEYWSTWAARCLEDSTAAHA